MPSQVDGIQIKAIQDQVNLRRTLVLVSSKSGTTIEPLSLADHFREQIRDAGVEDPDAHFVAITDPGTQELILPKILS